MTFSLPLLKGLCFILFAKKRFFLQNSFTEKPILVLKRTFVCLKNHKKGKLLAEGGEVPHLRGLIESRVLILIEIGLVFNVLRSVGKEIEAYRSIAIPAALSISGQKINKEKSAFLIGNASSPERNALIHQMTGFSQKYFPFTYMGCRIFKGQRKIIATH
ncbi:hypothetical protein M9H77_17161 [Catharanthus roseus]|uniref:Uncharacterized protein n=1 Tax=Catharanthus roseus TaxID=4058 RepID=A0ACC0B3T9_CATRO|nr:hypothetical protein M9H77_17161 [Catharanthus roseus]